ncbi:MAG: hypothetical protein AB7R90_16940 [Reyranellaceae bacterium]
MQPLKLEMAAQAYPLVRELSGAGTLSEWLSFVEERLRLGEQRGVIVCQRDAYIRGLFGWEMEKGVGDQRLIIIKHFSVPGVLPPRDVIDALLDAIETLAKQLGCREIRVEMPISATLHPAFAEHGLLPGSVGLHRKLVDTGDLDKPNA